MASYHLTVKAGPRGKAAAHAAYIAREGKYSGHNRYEDLEATTSGNMPAWAAHNAAHFWIAADEHERVNGSAYREIEVALPREFTPSQRLELVEAFIAQELGDQHAYQFAIHTPKAALEKDDQPHAHIMYSERIRDGIARDPAHYFKRYNAKNPEKGGAKKASGGKLEKDRKAELVALRERWADLQNAHLEKHGHETRVDHRSLKDQGIDRAPEKHLGAIGISQLNTYDISALLEHRATEGELERSQQEVSMIDLSGDLNRAKEERAGQRQQALVQQNPKQAAERIKAKFIEADRAAWQQAEAARILKTAQEHRQYAQRLRDSEPQKPILFGIGDWQVKHQARHIQIQHMEGKADYAERQAQAILSGERKANADTAGNWETQAQLRLEREHPALARAAHAQHLEQQRQANATAKLDKALADFKNHAIKRQMKAFGYGDDGKHWQALPEQLRTMLEEFNKLTKEAQPVVLDRLREPKLAETLIQQLGQAQEKAQEQGHDRGWSR